MTIPSKRKSNLAEQLAGYAAAAPAAPPSGWSAHLGRWPLYAAAAGAALATASSADASVITGNFGTFISVAQSHIGPNGSAGLQKTLPIRTSLGALVGRFVAILEVGRQTFSNDYRHFGDANFLVTSSAGAVFTNGVQLHGRRFLQRFLLSQPVSGDHPHQFGSLCSRKTGRYTFGATVNKLYGEFASGVPGYAGFKLGNGDIGWIQLTWSSQAGNTFPDRLAFGNWAVSTEGGILAGTTIPAAPEPGTFPLALLACGAAGIAAWRKRRAAAANPRRSPISDSFRAFSHSCPRGPRAIVAERGDFARLPRRSSLATATSRWSPRCRAGSRGALPLPPWA